jgi:hypothetical protein
MYQGKTIRGTRIPSRTAAESSPRVPLWKTSWKTLRRRASSRIFRKNTGSARSARPKTPSSSPDQDRRRSSSPMPRAALDAASARLQVSSASKRGRAASRTCSKPPAARTEKYRADSGRAERTAGGRERAEIRASRAARSEETGSSRVSCTAAFEMPRSTAAYPGSLRPARNLPRGSESPWNPARSSSVRRRMRRSRGARPARISAVSASRPAPPDVRARSRSSSSPARTSRFFRTAAWTTVSPALYRNREIPEERL